MEEFQWIGSGQLFTFTAWDSTNLQPDAISEDDICVFFYANLGWHDDVCSATRSIMCEF
jgi:hypothetical protein